MKKYLTIFDFECTTDLLNFRLFLSLLFISPDEGGPPQTRLCMGVL